MNLCMLDYYRIYRQYQLARDVCGVKQLLLELCIICVHCEQKVNETEILEFAKTQLTLPDKIDPSDAMNWQHTLYSQLGGGRVPRSNDTDDKKLVPAIDDTVERIVAMAKVLFGLHIVSIVHFL